MRTLTLLLLATFLALASAQGPAQKLLPPPQAASTATQAPPQPVVVDVAVEDRDGKPVLGLHQEDFILAEDNTPQVIHSFQAHTAQNPPAPSPELPSLPPGTFTDYTPLPPGATLNILLLDALNTPAKDPAFLRRQLQDYVHHAAPDTRLAIFGLASRLILLQGFTSDPQTLRDAVDHKLIPRAATPLDTPVPSDAIAQLPTGADTGAPGMAQTAANLRQFEASLAAMQIQFRPQYTLDALNTLAHYLAAFPGRKNLLWFAGSFPIDVLPHPTPGNTAADLDQQEYRETIALLARAQVAIYPIDARGLMTAPGIAASPSGSKRALPRSRAGAAAASVDSTQAAEHNTMAKLAEDTGGRAIFSAPDLASAVTGAVQAGADYYSLTYTPTHSNHDGNYHKLSITLAPARAAALSKPSTEPGATHLASDMWVSPDSARHNDPNSTNPQLTYRHGYYDAPPAPPPTQATSSAYAHAAMARGAPALEDILFKVRILPASIAPETVVARDNQLNPLVPVNGPFHRYAIDYAALPDEITMDPQPDGRHSGHVQFLVYVYNRDGRLLNSVGRAYTMNLRPETYQAFLRAPLQFHVEISVPDHAETYLRIAIQDVPSNRFGVVELPTATVSRLPPGSQTYAHPATPSTSPAPATTPSTPPHPAPPPPR